MPHTSHRRADDGCKRHSKLVNVSAQDGWSVVTRRKPERRPSAAGAPGPQGDTWPQRGELADAQQMLERLTPAQVRCYVERGPAGRADPRAALRPKDPVTTFAELTKALEQRRRALRVERVAETILQRLRACHDPSLASRVRKGVCLGLGSPSCDRTGWNGNALWQLAAFAEIMGLFRTEHCQTLLYAQDPIFNRLDREFLASLDINVCEDPLAFLEIDGSALVFAPHFPIVLWPPAMRRGEASLVIGNEIDVAGSLDRIPDEVQLSNLFRRHCNIESESEIPDIHLKEELRRFDQFQESFQFPWAQAVDHGFANLRVYCGRSEW